MRKFHGLSKPERLNKSFEFKKARDKGTVYRNGVFLLTIAPNDAGCHRLGMSVGSAKIRLASTRNRIKRLIREIFRLNKHAFKDGPFDIVISIRRQPSYKLDYTPVEKNLLALLKKAKVL